MTFILRMALREIRASWQRLLFFFVCIAIGVAAIIALRSVIQSVRTGLASESRSLIAADMLLTSNRDFTPKVLDTLAAEQKAGRVTADLRSDRDPDDGAAGGSVEGGDADGGAARGAARVSVLRDADAEGRHLLARHAAEPRRHRAAGAARAARPRGRRSHPDRQRAVRDPRRDRVRARAQPRRVQPRAARDHRLRGAEGHRAPVVRQPRLASAAAAGARRRRSTR